MGHDFYSVFISGIPEDPFTAEEYYVDAFDSCSEESEEEAEDTVFSGLQEEVKDEELQSDYRTNQQVHSAPRQKWGVGEVKEVFPPEVGDKALSLLERLHVVSLDFQGPGAGRAPLGF